jgi:hypothetical protein
VRIAVAVTLAFAFAAPAQAAFVQFRTPSANIGCAWSSDRGDRGGYLRCDILTGLKPRPPKPRGCELDWGFGFAMAPTGRATTVCAGDTAVDRRARVLRYGTKWSRGGFTCTSRQAGLRCANKSKHGFVLSRAHSYRL